MRSTAAIKGHRSAQLALGSLKAQTAASDDDWIEAVHWYRAAADAGHPGAMMSLARLYEGAYGVPADLDAALALYHKALTAGHKEAAGEIERLVSLRESRIRGRGVAGDWATYISDVRLVLGRKRRCR